MSKANLLLICLLVLGTATAGSGKRSAVLVFVAQKMFREQTLELTRRQLSHAGYRVTVAAAETTIAVSMNQTVIRPDIALADACADSFAALVLIGGSGMTLFWDDSIVHARCREFAEAGRLVGSIGLANVCLARAGLLEGHKATIFPHRAAVEHLLEGGAYYVPNPVVVDRNIITADQTSHVRGFAKAIVTLLDRR